MKKMLMIAPLALFAGLALADGHGNMDAKLEKMIQSSFKANGQATMDRMDQDAVQKACSSPDTLDDATRKKLEAAEMKTIKWPSNGDYWEGGDWKEGHKIAFSGRGLTWRDKPDAPNGGGCYNCHGLDPAEMSYGTIGVNLQGYAKIRGRSEEIVKYTWGKIYNAKAYHACSDMPRNGYGGILTEEQIRHVMAYLFDPESPVNK
ncbi:sulfur oxidation c-type cytochrome SoxX [Pseudazoarcus pumilus]|uniref:Sulfur oxidation c-type cytochrome SoxX n=1 Tax=Pseudazoarcus pumilus TaxID=2067960 RepID=A0A2I6S861_9RHOO|nr:sulfur oxidation c-type cytochrome SoxX [Pseudazoarcus pumilus]AUN95454.1 sulfur oxidation c-type cytochrome SoxX [Pseudazoarcus pumilus]